ncbi:MAG TPA: hypothetical protein VK606_12255, partial [Verrucomicrobiae bacterium]|nr:hypothetical protein [Verrucomicrobiae bacterium]
MIVDIGGGTTEVAVI